MRLIPEHKRERENSHVLTIDTRGSWEPQEKSLILKNDFVLYQPGGCSCKRGATASNGVNGQREPGA